MVTDEAALLAESHRIDYRLRSTFFYRKLKEYNTLALPLLIASLFPAEDLYSWDERAQWGIGENAFAYIRQHPDLHVIEVFCHPKLLREHPRLIAYYRNIAALSQKGVGYLVGIDVKKIESDENNKTRLNDVQILHLAQLFNEHSTLIIDSSIESFTKNELHGILLASTGAQIDGSWRNAIGEEAEKVVQRLLVKEAKERNLIAALIPRMGIAAEMFDPMKINEQLGRIEHYKGIMLNNKTSLLFSSEPDVSLLGVNGKTVGVLEVKGGSDPAGALERYGAAKKSFEEARRSSAAVATILIASCITTEVHARIQTDPTISTYYNLTEMLGEESTAYQRFMDHVFALLGNGATS